MFAMKTIDRALPAELEEMIREHLLDDGDGTTNWEIDINRKRLKY